MTFPIRTLHATLESIVLPSRLISMNDLNPVYNEDFYVPVAHYVENLRFEVKDRDFNLYAQMIGETFLPVQELLKWDENGKPLRVGVHKKAWLDNKKSHGNLNTLSTMFRWNSWVNYPWKYRESTFSKQTGTR